MRQVLFIVIWLFLPLVVHAQHVNSWGRLTVKNNVNKRWSVEEEFQLRRQSYKDYNLFHYPLMYSFRWFINYKVNDNIQIVLSPLASFQFYPGRKRIHQRYTNPVLIERNFFLLQEIMQHNIIENFQGRIFCK